MKSINLKSKKNKFIKFLIVIFLSGNFFYALDNRSYGETNSDKSQDNRSSTINDPQSNSSEQIDLNKSAYIIGPGDTLDLIIFDLPEYYIEGGLKVINDGSASFPIIGSQNVSNLTLEQARKYLKEKYKKEILNPEIQLNLKNPRPIKISVIGEVKSPGIYSIKQNNPNQFSGQTSLGFSGMPTVVDAIQIAGGIKQMANLKEVKLLRKLPGYKSQYKTTSLDLFSAIFEGQQDQNLYLFDGDIIKLSKSENLSTDIKKISQINISPKTIQIYVIGQVNQPGKMEVSVNTPLVQAIYLAGGPINSKANKKNVELIRIKDNGTAIRKKFNIKLNKSISAEYNPPLIDQDVVYVRSNVINRVNNNLGTLSETINPVVTGITLLKLLGVD